VERNLGGLAACPDNEQKGDGREGGGGFTWRGGEDLVEVQRPEVDHDEEHGEREAEVANAVHDEGLVAGGGRALLDKVGADQQVTAETDAFPADEEDHVIRSQHQGQHEKHEQVEVREEAVVAFLVGHVAGGVDVDERTDAGDDHEHDHRELVDGEIPADVEFAALNPGEVVFVKGGRGEIARGHENLHDPAEREDDTEHGDQVDQRLRKFAAEDAVDQEPDEGQDGNEPEILHQFFRELISSMFRVSRFLNTVRMMARPTAASAAATTITKNVKMCPATCLCWLEKATKLRLTAFSINSMHMKTVMMLRRKRKPATPSAKMMALRMRYQEIGTPLFSACSASGINPFPFGRGRSHQESRRG